MLQAIQGGSPLATTASTQRQAIDAVARPVPVAGLANVEASVRPPDDAEIGNVIADLNKVAQAAAQGVRFSVDEESGRTVVKVVDTQTDAVLRQIPTVEALKLWRSIEQMQGSILRDKA